MRAVLPLEEGSRGVPRLGELRDPQPGPGEVAIEVTATALNHADLLQLAGHYPPPPGESRVPGLECAGVVAEVGEGVSGWRPGDRVMALLAGGGHATRAVAPEGQLMAVPGGMDLTAAAALPEAGLTAWTNLVVEGELKPSQSVLITGATGGMGTVAVQVAHHLGARVLAAGRDRERLVPLRELGADALVVLGEGLEEEVRQATGGRGVDLVFDLVGGDGLPRCLAALAPQGRLVLVGLLAGRTASVDLGDVLRRRLRLQGSVLRSRPRGEKARLVAGFAAFARPLLEAGKLRPVVGRVFPFERIPEAYEALRAGGVAGKVVVEV